jgi:hypothetical protein
MTVAGVTLGPAEAASGNNQPHRGLFRSLEGSLPPARQSRHRAMAPELAN